MHVRWRTRNNNSREIPQGSVRNNYTLEIMMRAKYRKSPCIVKIYIVRGLCIFWLYTGWRARNTARSRVFLTIHWITREKYCKDPCIVKIIMRQKYRKGPCIVRICILLLSNSMHIFDYTLDDAQEIIMRRKYRKGPWRVRNNYTLEIMTCKKYLYSENIHTNA